MSSSDIAISVRNLSKVYTIAHNAVKHTTMAEALVHRIRHPFERRPHESFWALKDLSLEVKKGSVVGVIGRNGAGKSTFLKILSRITEPTEGKIDLYGRVGSLLEVGTGFHPELTGRENIYLNGQILGMRRREIDSNFDAIVAFADVEKFLDTPVKRYSSGMYVRLAFAVAAYLSSEILVVDEVLAVGDAEFQKKCLGKMSDVARSGRTVLFVSHNMSAISALCGEAVVLHEGRVKFQGSAVGAIEYYARGGQFERGAFWERGRSGAISSLSVRSVRASVRGGHPDQVLAMNVCLESFSPHKPAFLAINILDVSGQSIMQSIPSLDHFITAARREHELAIEVDLPPLIPGQYLVSVWVGSHYTATLDWAQECVGFEIRSSPSEGRTFPHDPSHGYIVPTSRVECLGDPAPRDLAP